MRMGRVDSANNPAEPPMAFPREPARMRRRRAFTTIELIVAISVLVVLVALVAFGFRSVTESGKGRQPQVVFFNNTGTDVSTINPTPDLWRDGNPTDSPADKLEPDPLVAP